ncbi:sugar kinase [Hirschia litorea]|uniref:Sugar kinase n=1 Tax=Hirschia litorea TaxID=1199156 RepID=A0ABW2IH69_9PROT
MIDLRKDLTETWRVATKAPSKSGGRTIMFMSAMAGEGTSSVAASFAMLAAQRARKGVWLVDLNLMNGTLFKAFDRGGEFSDSFGRIGPAHNAELDNSAFFSISPPPPPPPPGQKGNSGLFVVHRVGDSKLLVSRFRKERLDTGQRVRVKTGADYWKAVREIADWVIVDAPPLASSSAGLAVCSQMDATALVVRADKTPATQVSKLGQEIEGHGGTCMGIVLNATRADARLADELSG